MDVNIGIRFTELEKGMYLFRV